MSLTTQGNPRIESLDVLRGVAILGILIVNAPYFAATWHSAMLPSSIPLAVDQDSLWSWLVMHVFFEFKFITLFSMLFGVSLYLVGGERSDKDKGAQLRRRLSWLLLFGLIHGVVIWYGDILLNYAICGFLVLFCRSWRPGTLLFWGLFWTLLSSALIALAMWAMQYAPPEALEQQSQAIALSAEQFAAITERITGGPLSTLQQNASWWLQFFAQALLFITPRTVGIMMVGMALFKWGFMSGKSPVWLYVLFLVLGAASFAVLWLQGLHEFEAGFPLAMVQGEGMLVTSLLSPICTLSYVSLFILILKSGALGFVMKALAATGRMAFTNYIAQSLIMTTIFWRLGYFGEVTREQLWLVVGGVWLTQLIWSPLWLSTFAMGPLEWVWRCLTYKRWVPITKRRAQEAAPA
jgi:uncharacterized protein